MAGGLFGGAQSVPTTQSTTQNINQAVQQQQQTQALQQTMANPAAQQVGHLNQWAAQALLGWDPNQGQPGAAPMSGGIPPPMLQIAGLGAPTQQAIQGITKTGMGMQPLVGQGQDYLSQAAGYFPQAQGYIGQGAGFINTAGQPISAQDVQGFYNPMAANITASMQDIFGQQNLASRIGSAAKMGGVGGDRAAVAQSLLAQQQGLAAGQTYAGLYQQALQAAQQQKAQQLAAGQGMVGAGAGLGGLGTSMASNLAFPSMTAGMLGMQQALQASDIPRQIEQQKLNALFQAQQAQYEDPFRKLAALSGALPTMYGLGQTGLQTGALTGGTNLAGTQLGSGQSQTTFPAPPILPQIAGLGSVGLGLLGKGGVGSDIRLKTDIEKLGREKNTGLPLYAFRYKGDPKTYPKVVGPMAQDVAKVFPEAVSQLQFGGAVDEGYNDYNANGYEKDSEEEDYTNPTETVSDASKKRARETGKSAMQALNKLQKSGSLFQPKYPRVDPIQWPRTPWQLGSMPGYQTGGAVGAPSTGFYPQGMAAQLPRPPIGSPATGVYPQAWNPMSLAAFNRATLPQMRGYRPIFRQEGGSVYPYRGGGQDSQTSDNGWDPSMGLDRETFDKLSQLSPDQLAEAATHLPQIQDSPLFQALDNIVRRRKAVDQAQYAGYQEGGAVDDEDTDHEPSGLPALYTSETRRTGRGIPMQLPYIRQQQVEELDRDPSAQDRLYRTVAAEDPANRVKQLESIFNRAAARKQSLKEAAGDPDYYPRTTLDTNRDPGSYKPLYDRALNIVTGGSNTTNYSTGNASGDVGFGFKRGANDPYMVKTASGERYGVENHPEDLAWARERAGWQGTDLQPTRLAMSNEDPRADAYAQTGGGTAGAFGLPRIFPGPQGGGGLFSPQTSQGLIQAGLGMLAASGQRDARGLPMSPLAAIGQGGMRGLEAMQEQKALDLKQQLAQQAQDFKLAQLGISTRRADIAERGLKSLEEARKATAEARTTQAELNRQRAGAVFSPETVDMLADQAMAGDKSIFTNLVRGVAGPQNLVAVRNRMNEKMRAADWSGADIAAVNANFMASAAAARTAAVREANIQTAVNEAKNTFPLALEASKALPRTDFVPINQLLRMWREGTSNPEQGRLAVAVQGAITAYSQAMSRTGVNTVHAQRRAEDLLGTVTSHEALQARIDQMDKEMDAALKAPEATRKAILSKISGKNPGEAIDTDEILKGKKDETAPKVQIPEGAEKKTIDGKTYYKKDGKWYGPI